jgi:hypothetical protein
MPNTSFQRTRVRGGRGPGPLNPNRLVGEEFVIQSQHEY